MRSLFSRLLDQYAELVAALQFLSILPVPGSVQRFAADDEKTVPSQLRIGGAYFSLVGLVLGLLLSLLIWLCNAVLPHLALAALLVVALVILTGGLHLDGLMDSCDGLFGGRTRERILEIMRDSRVGSFGVLGGICVLLLKFAFLASLENRALSIALLVILPASRWAMLIALYVFPSARSIGLGVTFRQSITLPQVIIAGVIALLITLLLGHLTGLFAWLMALLFAFVFGAWVTRRIGGMTGDTYGALAELTEVLTLLLLVLLRSWL